MAELKLSEWVTTATAGIVLYPAAMAFWFWFSAVLLNVNVVMSCGGPHAQSVNCLGEGRYELAWMTIGLASGMYLFVVTTFGNFVKIGKWISARRFFAGRPPKEVLPRQIVPVWTGAVLVLTAMMGLNAAWIPWHDPYGVASIFESEFLTAIEAAFPIIAFCGIRRGMGV